MQPDNLSGALMIIRTTPGYETSAAKLDRLIARNKLRVNMNLPDRAQAGLFGTIKLGPEAVEASPLSLAQTLIHEQFHLQQNVFLKTVSFWAGVFTRTHVMLLFERPAYQAAISFLDVVKQVHPQLSAQAAREQWEVRQVFALGYGTELH